MVTTRELMMWLKYSWLEKNAGSRKRSGGTSKIKQGVEMIELTQLLMSTKCYKNNHNIMNIIDHVMLNEVNINKRKGEPTSWL